MNKKLQTKKQNEVFYKLGFWVLFFLIIVNVFAFVIIPEVKDNLIEKQQEKGAIELAQAQQENNVCYFHNGIKFYEVGLK